ncbi:hypothetical protein ACJWDR_37710 [Streptomyces tauricus]|uniref:hypothetical protein n=1 Tax=Streptomyces tauricus TaxID=68274 RepID=UPI00387F09EA
MTSSRDALLRDTEAHLSALHGSVARHDNLAANLACSGCELRDRIRTALADEPAAPSRRLEDGSTHTVEALTDAGEECVQHQCTAARQEDQLRQEQYTLRAAVEAVLDEVRDMADDEQIGAEAARVLRARLRSALGLDSASV